MKKRVATTIAAGGGWGGGVRAAEKMPVLARCAAAGAPSPLRSLSSASLGVHAGNLLQGRAPATSSGQTVPLRRSVCVLAARIKQSAECRRRSVLPCVLGSRLHPAASSSFAPSSRRLFSVASGGPDSGDSSSGPAGSRSEDRARGFQRNEPRPRRRHHDSDPMFVASRLAERNPLSPELRASSITSSEAEAAEVTDILSRMLQRSSSAAAPAAAAARASGGRGNLADKKKKSKGFYGAARGKSSQQRGKKMKPKRRDT